jgi:multidrug resistance efflux pump
MLIADGLRQAETNLAEQEANMRKLTDQITAAQNQVNQLQSMRIASMAQRNLLSELQKKIVELQSA